MAIRVTVRLEWAIAALLVILGVVVGTSAAYAQTVVDPRIAEFDPSPDHDATLPDGQSAVRTDLHGTVRTPTKRAGTELQFC